VLVHAAAMNRMIEEGASTQAGLAVEGCGKLGALFTDAQDEKNSGLDEKVERNEVKASGRSGRVGPHGRDPHG